MPHILLQSSQLAVMWMGQCYVWQRTYLVLKECVATNHNKSTIDIHFVCTWPLLFYSNTNTGTGGSERSRPKFWINVLWVERNIFRSHTLRKLFFAPAYLFLSNKYYRQNKCKNLKINGKKIKKHLTKKISLRLKISLKTKRISPNKKKISRWPKNISLIKKIKIAPA